MGKPRLRKEMLEAKAVLKEMMQTHLLEILESLVDQIMQNYRKLGPSNKINAIKDLIQTGINSYRANLLKGVAVIAATSIDQARQEIPRAKNIELREWTHLESLKLGEFEKLPPKIRKRLKGQVDLLVDTQKKDLDKVVMFQFSSSNESTDSEDQITYDIYQSGEDWVYSNSVDAGAGVIASRTINESRQAFFWDDEVLKEIDAFVFMNDDPKTEICKDLSNNGEGKIFSGDDPGAFRYNPPLHYNCHSYILPILKGNLKDQEIEQLKPSSSDLEDQIQFIEKCPCGGQLFFKKIN